ncbi:MAG: hypothetical protein ACUVX9_09335 [Anaerolineae bacterium]
MKKPAAGHCWFFVDESGDPTFYDRAGNLIVGQEGCSPLLLLGFIETRDPYPIRQAVLALQKEVVEDPYFRGVPSLARTAVAFHAKDDVPEIRYRFFKLIQQMDFGAQIVLARKIERVFRNSFQAREEVFYDHLASLLFQNVLHRFETNHIYFAKRGSRDRQAPLTAAIRQGIARFEAKWGTSVNTCCRVQAQRPGGEPCLSVIDYVNWAVYQAYTRGDMRFYNVVADKVRLLVDLYDTARYPHNWYSRRNPFSIEKATPL